MRRGMFFAPYPIGEADEPFNNLHSNGTLEPVVPASGGTIRVVQRYPPKWIRDPVEAGGSAVLYAAVSLAFAESKRASGNPIAAKWRERKGMATAGRRGQQRPGGSEQL